MTPPGDDGAGGTVGRRPSPIRADIRSRAIGVGARRTRRSFPVGVELVEQGAHVRVWAPARRRVELVIGPAVGAVGDGFAGGSGSLSFVLEPEAEGYFSRTVAELEAGMRYGFRLDGSEKLYPDPASRFQPEGPHGLSEVVDPVFAWTDDHWRGMPATGQVLYEIHVGTFTLEGTYAAAATHLTELRDLGITAIEVMPLHEFPGRFGWGYDGVDLWSPSHLYGRPDDLRQLVDDAHGLGLSVILDVVYNHFGPSGNYLKEFAADYFTSRYCTEWGEALNFDGQNSRAVREFVVENAAYWIEEFHFDGLRLDATQSIFDSSSDHVLAAVGRRVREAGAHRATYVVAENEPQETRLVRPADKGGFALNALWNDDFHHAAAVALTGRREAYCADYTGSPQELLSAIRWGYLYQGQFYRWQNKLRGTPGLDLNAENFVLYLENHDQVANSGPGARLSCLADPGRLRALTALWLLAPATPMFFQGQEFGSTRPFFYFADHEPELAAIVAKGRREFLSQFPSLASPEAQQAIADPASEVTFRACKLDWSERSLHDVLWTLHRDLLTLRREDPAFRQQRSDRVAGAVLGAQALGMRYFCEEGDRLLLLNMGPGFDLDASPEPLLAPPGGAVWRLHWSSEDLRYGGGGAAPMDPGGRLSVPGHAALVLAPSAPLDGPRRA